MVDKWQEGMVAALAPSPKKSKNDVEDPWVSTGILFGQRLSQLPKMEAIRVRMEIEKLISYAEMDAITTN